MTAATHIDYNANTDSVDVAAAFRSSIQSKTILITGVNRSGIGFATALAFASQSPAQIIITGRSATKIQDSINALQSAHPKVTYTGLELDLSRQASVRAAAAKLLSMSSIPTIDLLINNAGVMLIPERTLSDDNIEMHFATNHIGHFLFTNLLLPKLTSAASSQPKGTVRIINLSSSSPLSAGIRFSDINFTRTNNLLPPDEQPNYASLKPWGEIDPEHKSYIAREAYSQSKVANLLFSIGINDHYYDSRGILSLAVNPGVIATELQRHFSDETAGMLEKLRDEGKVHVKTVSAGAATTLVAALDPMLGRPVGNGGGGSAAGVGEGKGENYGAYLRDCQIDGKADARAVSSANAGRLWRLSEELVGETFH